MRFGSIALALLAATMMPGCQSAAGNSSEAAKAPTIPVTIKTATGTHVFNAEVARTPEEQARGLMFRASMPADHAMLFPYEPVRPASFWMENTPLPLDLIFIRADGTIARIAAEAIPYSRDPIPSGEPVGAILEINGGRADALNISEGDRVSWPGGPKG